MNMKPLKITKKEAPRGEDGYKVFSIRIKEETITELESIAQKTNRSRNELIGLFLDYAIDNWELDDN